MDFERFSALGRKIDAAWGRVDRDERAFPAIASEALGSFEPGDFDLNDVGRFLLDTSIRQQPDTAFSNLPVTVHQGDNFHLELLVWTHATALIHQHAFSGAFRVMVGSSLHVDYAFNERKRINSRLLFGDIEAKRMRSLRVGDTLPILSGRGGLIHSLFHLDEPSVTLVARTGEDPDSAPQYAYFRPGFAFDHQWADADSRVSTIRRWFGVAASTKGWSAADALLERIAGLDPARLFAVMQRIAYRLPSEVLEGLLLSKLRVHQPELAEGLVALARITQCDASLIKSRGTIKDPDLRFFIALMLNAPSRAWVMDIIRARVPSSDPEETCAGWLLRIGDPHASGLALRNGSPLLLRLGMAFASVGAEAPRLANAITRGTPVEQAFATLATESTRLFEALLQADRTIRTTPELAVLFEPDSAQYS